MKIELKNLNLEMIEGCQEAQSWLRQFPENKRATAIGLLTHLQFVSRDTYSEWLKTVLLRITKKPCAFYAVRKFDDDLPSLWEESGVMVGRPSYSLGSEDLVQSVISNLKKSKSKVVLDHPSLSDIKNGKIHDVVLIDDSIGSGERVSSFIKKMMSNKTFLSWWSFGWIRLYIVAFARTHESSTKIIRLTTGSDHPLRKFPKSDKMFFISHLVYHKSNLAGRWGTNYQSTVDLCNSVTEIPATRRMGYDSAMTNVVFYHSVPNNLPGVLWFQNEKWNALFPRRTLPEWLPLLLEGNVPRPKQKERMRVSEGLLAVLRLIKRGIRNKNTLAREMGLDASVLEEILSKGRAAGFLTNGNHLTKTGVETVWEGEQGPPQDHFNRSLYIPQSWCVGRGTVQPSGLGGRARRIQTDSTDD